MVDEGQGYTRHRPIPVTPALVRMKVNRNLGWPFLIQPQRQVEARSQSDLYHLLFRHPRAGQDQMERSLLLRWGVLSRFSVFGEVGQ